MSDNQDDRYKLASIFDDVEPSTAPPFSATSTPDNSQDLQNPFFDFEAAMQTIKTPRTRTSLRLLTKQSQQPVLPQLPQNLGKRKSRRSTSSEQSVAVNSDFVEGSNGANGKSGVGQDDEGYGDESDEEDDYRDEGSSDSDVGARGKKKKGQKSGSGGKKSNRRKKGSGNDQDDEKRRDFLERNRRAAMKCRQRKKVWLESLKAKVDKLEYETSQIRHEIQMDEQESEFLRHILAAHQNSCQLTQ